MLKRLCFWAGIALLILGIGLIVAKQFAIHNLEKSLSSYDGGQTYIKGAKLYLDGLSVKEIKISDHLVLKNVLFGHKTIKHVETMELTLKHGDNFLKKELPFNLYDDLNIKFITLHVPFLDDVISFDGRLSTSEKSDGSIGYTLNFTAQEGQVRAKGTAEFDLKDQKINQMNITLEKGGSRYDWLQTKRATGWWDYNGITHTHTGEITIGSLEWQNIVLDNVQLALADDRVTFSGDLPAKAGQVDGDLTLQEKPKLSLAVNATDLSVFENMSSGEANLQANLLLDDFDLKTGSFDGKGSVTGHYKTANNTIDFDYKGGFTHQDQKITATPDKCLNASLSLKRTGNIINLPAKHCFEISSPVVLKRWKLQSPIKFSASQTPYLFKNAIKTLRGKVANLTGQIRTLDDIVVSFENAAVTNKPIKGIALHHLSGSVFVGKGVLTKNLKASVSYNGQGYSFAKNGKKAIVIHKKSGQKIADFTGSIIGQRYRAEGTFNGALSLISADAKAGQAFYNGTIDLDIHDPLSAIAGQGILKITNGSIAKGDLVAQGLNADIKVQSLKPLVTSGKQMVEVKTGKIGRIPFENAVLYFDKVKGQAMNIHSAQLNAMGAVWHGKNHVLTAEVSLTDVLRGSNFEGLKITPLTLNGRMNLSVENDGVVTLKNSVFKATHAGVIKYDLNKRPSFLNAGSDYYDLQRMRDILADFQFTELAIPMGREGVQGLYILGTHPDHNNGKPIEFDLTTVN